VEAWLSANRWAPRTRLGYLREVRSLYNWGLKRNLVSHNPANAVEAPMQIDKEPAIHSPGQVSEASSAERLTCVTASIALPVWPGSVMSTLPPATAVGEALPAEPLPVSR
jgi:hypothetical protein